MVKGFDVAHIMPIGILAGDSDAMILSSADILRILGGNEIIRLSAKLSITDGRPSLSGREGTYIYVERFPVAKEFEATWSIYIESDEDIDLVVAEIKRLLPKVEIEQGLLTVAKTTDFRSESTQTAPEAPKVKTAQVDLKQYEERFQSLVEDVQDQMLLIHSGRAGKDGQDGRDGADGRDGKDLVATEAELFDLQDVEQGIQIEPGQVLTWDGSKWTNLYVRQSMSPGGAAGGSNVKVLDDLNDVNAEDPQHGDMLVYDSLTSQFVLSQVAGGGGIPECPNDGNYYVRRFGEWVDLRLALSSLGVAVDEPIDGGNFTTGFSSAGNDNVLDGGNFTTGASNSTQSGVVDGGDYTSGSSGSTYGA